MKWYRNNSQLVQCKGMTEKECVLFSLINQVKYTHQDSMFLFFIFMIKPLVVVTIGVIETVRPAAYSLLESSITESRYIAVCFAGLGT